MMTSRALGPGMERGELMRGEEGELRPLQVEPLSPGSVASPGTVPWLLCLLPDELLAPLLCTEGSAFALFHPVQS